MATVTIPSESELTRHTARAHERGIRLRLVFYATSGRTGEYKHETIVSDADLRTGTCTCEAGARGLPCCHLAAAISATRKMRSRTISEAGRVLANQRHRTRRQNANKLAA